MNMKPTTKTFQKAVEKYGGNLTKVAKAFDVSRSQVYRWLAERPELQTIVDDARGSIFDDCLSTARLMAMGIPDVQDGKVVGYLREPDGPMVRYLLSTLGKKEGFGDSLDVTTNGKDISGVNLFKVLTKEEIAKFNEDFDEEY